MAQTLRKKFKRIFKGGKCKVRDVCIILSHYFNDAHNMDYSPMALRHTLGQEELLQNFALARIYYSKLWNMPVGRPKDQKPKQPKDGTTFISTSGVLEKYDASDDTWNKVTDPILP